MRRSLRITFVAPFGIRQRSTVWARTLPLAHELDRLGHSTCILIPPWDSPADAGTLRVKHGVPLEHVAISGGLPCITARLLQRIQYEHPDVVHIVKPRAYAGIVQWCIWQARRGRIGSSRIVLDIDDWERPWAAINRYPRYQALFLQWQEEWGIRHADGIAAASGWLVDWASRAAPSTPVAYVPNGIKPVASGAQREYGRRRPPRVLFLSRFVEVSPTWLADFWQVVQQEMSGAVLLLAGKALHAGGERPFLDSLAAVRSSGRGSNVVWRGFINPADLGEIYASVDCAVFPSEGSDLLKAKCSVRMATALQYGVPVVASDVGEQAAYGFGDAAQLLPPDAPPAQFARAVAEVLKSETCRQSMGRAAAERMNSEYRWSKLALRLERLYWQVLSNG